METYGLSRLFSLENAKKAVASIMVLYHLAYVSGFLFYIGLYFQVQAHRGFSLGLMLIFIFLTLPARKGTLKSKVPWFDIVLILFSLAACGYYGFFYNLAISHFNMGTVNNYESALMFLLIIAILEAGRRLLGVAMPIIVIVFLIYVFFSDYFPGFLNARGMSLSFITETFYFSAFGIFGMPFGVASTIVIMFIIFSSLLSYTGAGRFFITLALSLFGFTRGGPAKAAVLASALTGMISGTIAGNVAATGSITIPLLKRTGYKPYFAGAVEAVASKGGQVTPPVMGAVAFLMAEFLGISYATICIAAAVPAAIYFISVFTQVDLRAARNELQGIPRDQLPSFWKTIKDGWQFLLPLIVLIVLIVFYKYSIALAGFYATAFLFIVSLFKKASRLGPAKLVEVSVNASSTVIIAGIACALAGPILASLDVTGLGTKIATDLVLWAGENRFLLLILSALACFVFGMGMSAVGIYLILATLVGSALIHVGIEPIAAHLFIIYWGNVSFITPPVAIGAYVAAGIAGADPIKTAWQACRLGIVSFIIPFMFAYNPELLLIGSFGSIVRAVITAVIGILTLASGIEGWIVRATNWIERFFLIIGGLMLMFPELTTDFIGFAIVILVIIYDLFIRKNTKGRIERKNT